MKKEKKKEINVKLLRPKIFYDIEDIVEILQEKETSILVNLKHYNDCESISEIIRFVLKGKTSYATIKTKRISPKCFVCWSKHNNT